jgi:hypothetical protein
MTRLASSAHESSKPTRSPLWCRLSDGTLSRVLSSIVLALVAVLPLCVWGCNLLMDLGRFHEAGADGDAGSSGGEDAGPWDCLNGPGETLDPSASSALSILVYDPTQAFTAASAVDGGSDLDILSYTPLRGVSVAECPLFNSCASPTSEQLTNDAGIAQFSVNGAFNGYFMLTRSDLVPSTFYPGQLVTGLSEATDPTVMLSPGTASGLGASLGVPVALDPDGGLGNAIFSIFDCDDRHGSGVVFTISNSVTETLLYYIKDGLPSTAATETTTYGTGGVNNVPVGSLTVTATLFATQKPLGSVSVVIRPGQYSYLWIRARTH